MRVCVRVRVLSHVRLFATPWSVAHQTPLSMRFSRQEYWSGLPFPILGDLPYPGTELTSPVSPALKDFMALNTHTEATKSEDFEVRTGFIFFIFIFFRTGFKPCLCHFLGTQGKLFNPFFSYVKVLQEVNYIVWIKQDEIKLSDIQQCEACLKLEVLVWKCNKA